MMRFSTKQFSMMALVAIVTLSLTGCETQAERDKREAAIEQAAYARGVADSKDRWYWDGFSAGKKSEMMSAAKMHIPMFLSIILLLSVGVLWIYFQNRQLAQSNERFTNSVERWLKRQQRQEDENLLFENNNKEWKYESFKE